MLQASLSNKLQLVNFESGKVAKTYSGHKNSKFCSTSTFVTTLGPRPCIAAGSEDGSLYVWDVNSRKVGGGDAGCAVDSSLCQPVT
jgi:COMPASS component SWD3